MTSHLTALDLNRSVVRLGQPEAYSALLRRLDAGKPLRLGVFGASVAQHGGSAARWVLSGHQSRAVAQHGGPRGTVGALRSTVGRRRSTVGGDPQRIATVQ